MQYTRSMDTWAAVAAMGRKQFGLVTRAQLLKAGLGPAAIRWALEEKRLEWVDHCLYRLPGAPTSWRQRAREALLRAGPASALSHRTAAHLWRLDGFEASPWPFEVTVPHGSYVKRRLGLRVHQCRGGVVQEALHGLEVTPVARTLVDLAALVDEESLEIALDSAHRRFREVGDWILEFAAGRESRGMSGLTRLVDLVQVREGQHTESPLEVRVRRRLRRARHLPPPALQYRVFDAHGYVMRVDFGWPEERVAVHADGFQWHARRVTFDTDAEQRNRLAAAGWESLLVTDATLESPWLETLERRLHERAAQRSFPFVAR